MPKTSGTATSPENLLAQLDTFLTANGWTRDKFVDSGGGAGEYYWNNGGTAFVSVAYITSAIKLYPNTGFDTNDPVNGQPGMSLSGVGAISWNDLPVFDDAGTNIEGQVSNFAGPYTAHNFYLDQRNGADYLIANVEQSPGVSRWFGFGQAKPAGDPAINGCEFVATDHFMEIGTTESRLAPAGGLFANPSGSEDASWIIRLDLDGVALDWYGKGNGAPANLAATEDWVVSSNPYQLRTEAPYAEQFGYLYNTSQVEYTPKAAYSGIFPKVMCQIWATRPLGDATPDSVSLVARLPAMFFINMQQFTHNQLVDVDGDTYRIFAEGRKITHPLSGPAPNTQHFGVAMLEDL